jgi:hypothetical protein
VTTEADGLVNLSDLDILRDRVRCPRCRRWTDRLLLLADWSLACRSCARQPIATGDGTS